MSVGRRRRAGCGRGVLEEVMVDMEASEACCKMEDGRYMRSGVEMEMETCHLSLVKQALRAKASDPLDEKTNALASFGAEQNPSNLSARHLASAFAFAFASASSTLLLNAATLLCLFEMKQVVPFLGSLSLT